MLFIYYFTKATQREFEGFRRLFYRFLLADPSSSIEWDRIEKLPDGAVSNFIYLFGFSSYIQTDKLIQ